MTNMASSTHMLMCYSHLDDFFVGGVTEIQNVTLLAQDFRQKVLEAGLESGLAIHSEGRGLWPGAQGLDSCPQLSTRWRPLFMYSGPGTLIQSSLA